MAFIGNTNTTQAFTPAVDFFSGNASTTAFTLSRPVASVAQVQAVISNVPQDPGSAYTVSGNTITFTSAPPSGTNNIYVYYTSPITQVIAPGQGTVGTTSLAGGTVNTTADATINGLTVGKGGGALATNTAVGASALAATNTGGYSVGVGQNAGAANTSGQITAVGNSALYTNTTGSQNTAVGISSMYANTTGGFNTAIGVASLAANTTQNYNTAVGYQSGNVNTTGQITAVGALSLAANTTGTNNVAVGIQALQANTTAASNTAVGYQAGINNTTATQNVLIGALAGGSGVATGGYNVVAGYNAGSAMTSATGNVMVGVQAGKATTTGICNTFVGGSNSSYVGSSNTTGNNNTGIGTDALQANTTGSQNTAVGFTAGNTITTGTYNICMGYSAGSFGASLTTGVNNVYIGTNAGPSSAAVGQEIVLCALNSQGKGSNTGFINANFGGIYQGNNSSTWSTTSDQRLKKNIVDNTDGLSKITGIRVRNFEYRIAEEVTELPAHAVIDKQGVQLGVIAQELQTVLPDCVKTESTGVMSVDTDNLIWYLVNSIKEQQALITALTARITALENK